MTFDPVRLRNLRLKRRKSQRQIADQLGIDYRNYQYYEKPHEQKGYAPKEARLMQIAEALETSVGYLMGKTQDPNLREVLLSPEERQLIEAYRRGDLDVVNRILLEQARKSIGQ